MTAFIDNRMLFRRTHRAACALAAAAVLTTGCASTVNTSTQRVAVASDPPGARVFLDGQSVGVTPTVVTFDRRDRHPALRFEKDCYQDAFLEVPARTSKWVVGNLLFAGVPFNDYTVGQWAAAMALYATLGAVVDWRRGGAFTFPDLVRATLDRRPDAPEATLDDLVELDGDCAPVAPAGPADQGNTPSDR